MFIKGGNENTLEDSLHYFVVYSGCFRRWGKAFGNIYDSVRLFAASLSDDDAAGLRGGMSDDTCDELLLFGEFGGEVLWLDKIT